MQEPVAAGTGEGAALLLAGLLAGFLPVYLNQKGGCRTVFVQQPPFGWDGFIISVRRSICGRSGVPFLQGRLLLQQVCHAAQTDAKSGKVMQHGAGGRGQDAQSPQKDEGRVEAESPDKIIAALRGRYFSFTGNAP